ncbi:hypothetical protein Misp01_25150 [Microtetraspora sp. NBRC 13810]|uniref:helix-turn-helix transcriptional regulator n=1 Tax=Microtetraspora sp. NBRC 13810 TaxID=3030990 RepID=UPI00249FA77E|nr:hypothetical protein Misp01_25150 [Microtetraspora sp. NBRC 13810]
MGLPRGRFAEDTVVAVALAGAAVAECHLRGHGLTWAALAVLATLPHALRRTLPWASAGLTLLGACGFLAVGLAPFALPYTVLASGLLSFHTVLRELGRAPAWLLTGAAATGVVLFDRTLGGTRRETLVYALALAAAGALADFQRSRREVARIRRDSLEQIVAAQREQAALAERARIAREMHDIVAHSSSTIAVRAETAPYTLGEFDERVAREFTEVADIARQTLTEMRGLLGVLRSGLPDAPETRPQPGLALLPELIEGHAGQVEVVVTGPPRPLPPTVDLSAYRIVQEALTNIRTHAPGARARVELAYRPTALSLQITDKGIRTADLVAAVRTVAEGNALLAPTVTRRLIAEFAKAGRRSARPARPWTPGAPEEALTPRETEVLTLIARGLSNAEIATALTVSEHTVKTHVARLLAKLGLRDRTQAVIHAYETGMVHPGS